MEKYEAESEECLLLALQALLHYYAVKALYGLCLQGQGLQDSTTYGACLCPILGLVPRPTRKAGFGMWLHKLWPRKLSMWDGYYLESAGSSVLRLPSSSWAAPTEFMLLTASAVKFFNPWINATVSVLESTVFIQDGAPACLVMLIDVFACYILSPCYCEILTIEAHPWESVLETQGKGTGWNR